MNNANILKKIILERENRYIELDDSITPELLDLLVNTTCSVVDTLFKPVDKVIKSAHTHSLVITCSECGESKVVIYTITAIRGLLQKLRREIPVLCEQCLLKQKAEEEEILSKRRGPYKRSITDEEIPSKLSTREQNTLDYIRCYLACENTQETQPYWNVWKDPSKKWGLINVVDDKLYDLEKIASYIKSMSYLNFLNTPYWKTIAQHVKWQSGFTCVLCEAENKLAAHHKTYEHHGMEHIYWKTDLLCICTNCHEQHHKR